jgi:hypothetical protein
VRRRSKALSRGVGPALGGSRVAATLASLSATCFLALATSGTAAAACPNEAIREVEQATFLPDCRAYEQVSPANKNVEPLINSKSGIQGDTKASVSGNALAYFATGALVDSPSVTVQSAFRSERNPDGSGWSTQPLNAPQLPILNQAAKTVIDVSEDLSHSLVGSLVALAPGAVEGDGNLYLRDERTGAYTLIATSPDQNFREICEGLSVISPFVEGAPDFSRFVFLARPVLAPGAIEGAMNVYEWRNGEVRLLSQAPNGDIEPLGWQQLTPDGQPFKRSVSADGTRVFFQGEGTRALYMREGGITVPISVSQRAGEVGEVKPVFVAASAVSSSGGIVFFASEERLTDDSTADGGLELYRYDVEAGSLIDLTIDPDPGDGEAVQFTKLLGVSDDGSYAYFIAGGKLLADAVAGAPNLYVWHRGQLSLVATLDPSDAVSANVKRYSMSPSGAHFAFASLRSLTGWDNESEACAPAEASPGAIGPCEEVFAFNAPASSLRCVSCSAPGVPAMSHSHLGGEHGLGASSFKHSSPRPVLEDGSVFFDTPQPLIAGDSNGQDDVYRDRAGVRSLISTGRSASASRFAAASVDGSDVFFVTREALVGQDTDALADVYDARVGGGILAQNPPPAPPACQGADCRVIATPPSPPVAASGSYAGPGNVSARKAAKRCAKRKGAKQRARCTARKKKGQHKNAHRKAAKSRRAAS